MNAVEAMIQILKTPDIEAGMVTLSELVAANIPAPPPSLFLLSTQRAAFVGVFGNQKNSVRTRKLQFFEDRHVEGKREDLVIGFLEWDTPITQMDHCDREIVSAIIEEIYRRTYTQNFFAQIRRPVDFTNQDTYFRKEMGSSLCLTQLE